MQTVPKSTPTPSRVSLRAAIASTGISRSRLNIAIETGQVQAYYPGLRSIHVDLADVERLLRTPPNKAVPAPQQAA